MSWFKRSKPEYALPDWSPAWDVKTLESLADVLEERRALVGADGLRRIRKAIQDESA